MSSNLNQRQIKTIFILGYPRSGTTWFANLFNSHQDVVYRHEMIGRCYRSFPEDLFKKLKFDYSLTDDDYNTALNIILAANTESDRAPFFNKNHLPVSSPKIHYLLWITTKVAFLLKPLYRFLYTPRAKSLNLVIKETRSSVNMDSIINTLRSDYNIILFRHPCGAIASSLTGIKNGNMEPSSLPSREFWFNENIKDDYIKSLNLNSELIGTMPEYEYLALRWRIQNSDYLGYAKLDCNNIFINYEDVISNQYKFTQDLFKTLSLNYTDSVEDFVRASTGSASKTPVLKDSSSSYYSVYRKEGFDSNKWQETLSEKEIKTIENHTTHVFNNLMGQVSR